MYDLRLLPSLKRHWLLRTSNIPVRLLGMEPSDIVEKTGNFPIEVTEWLELVHEGKVIKQVGHIGSNGVGLLFDGNPGIGKTTHAVVAAMEFVRNLPDDNSEAAKLLGINAEDYGLNCKPVYYITYPEFLSRKKSAFDADLEDRREMNYQLDGLHGRSKFDWLNVRILIIDDLGKEYGSKYDDTSFDEILRIRYDKGLPTIVTTNVSLNDWGNRYGEAMASFAHEAFNKITIIGSDIRGEI